MQMKFKDSNKKIKISLITYIGGIFMNLEKLFEIQKILDKNITENHPLKEGEDRLDKKILALHVELAELAQEWRGFKFWSKDTEPRTFVRCKQCSGEGYGYFAGSSYTAKKEKCLFCGGSGRNYYKNPLLEEYVDVLHFILSIGLEVGYEVVKVNISLSDESLEIQFNELFLAVSEFYARKNSNGYIRVWEIFLRLGESLGFEWEEIEHAYFKKNEENHQRQSDGY